AHDAGERVDRLGAAGCADVLEQAEAVRDQDAARARRRIRQEAMPAEIRLHRSSPDHPVLLQVAERHRAAARRDMVDDRAAQLPLVELARAALREALERSREVALDEGIALA